MIMHNRLIETQTTDPKVSERRTFKIMSRLLEEVKSLGDDLGRYSTPTVFDVYTSPKERKHLRGLFTETRFKLRQYIKHIEEKKEEPAEPSLYAREKLLGTMIRKFR